MRISMVALATVLLLFVTASADAITAEELIAKNIQAKGGLEKIKAIQTVRLTGSIRFGSIDAIFAQMSKRPQMLRVEFSLQGLTGVNAYDGSTGWRISPFQGRVDPEKISEDEAKQMQMDADIEGPLVDYKSKGHIVEYLGTEDVDGTEAHKLKVTLKNGNVRYIYLDPDYFLEIRLQDQVRIRGAQQESETDLGNYEQVNGVYFPFSIEVGQKGQPKDQTITFEKVEVNVDLDDSLFQFPATAAKK
jgi:outer membrane lipoprotein-sorting protein